MSDWIEWKGGECPVESDVFVDIKFDSGYERTNEVGDRS